MKSYLIIFLLSLTSLISCNNDEVTDYNIEGNYIGTFQRGNNTSSLELQLSKNEFSGSSTEGYDKFPAICSGTYTFKNNEIIFNNTCIWTAEFDWSLILGGNWNSTFENNILTLKNSIGDVYKLKKQE